MIESLKKILFLSEKNLIFCPWCSQKTSKEYLSYLLSEIEELRKGIENNDSKNISEELGDIFWTYLVLMSLCEKEFGINKTEVMEMIVRKIEKRKPWLIESKKVTFEEAERIWNAAKKERI